MPGIEDPITFILLYYLVGINTEGFTVLLKLGLIFSLMLFPFILIGTTFFKKFQKKIKKNWLNLLITTFLITFLFWIVAGLWRTGFGLAFFSSTFFEFIKSFFFCSVFAFPFVLFGNYLVSKIHENWKIPNILALYMVGLCTSIIGWIFIWIGSILYPIFG